MYRQRHPREPRVAWVDQHYERPYLIQDSYRSFRPSQGDGVQVSGGLSTPQRPVEAYDVLLNDEIARAREELSKANYWRHVLPQGPARAECDQRYRLLVELLRPYNAHLMELQDRQPGGGIYPPSSSPQSLHDDGRRPWDATQEWRARAHRESLRRQRCLDLAIARNQQRIALYAQSRTAGKHVGGVFPRNSGPQGPQCYQGRSPDDDQRWREMPDHEYNRHQPMLDHSMLQQSMDRPIHQQPSKQSETERFPWDSVHQYFQGSRGASFEGRGVDFRERSAREGVEVWLRDQSRCRTLEKLRRGNHLLTKLGHRRGGVTSGTQKLLRHFT